MSGLRERIYKARAERNGLQRYVARRYLFPLAERLGFHILGDHFYEPIPNVRDLEAGYDESPREIPGHPLKLEDFESAHAQRLHQFGPEFIAAVRSQGWDMHNYYFWGADALSYYALLRERKPPAVIEIGQGQSTRIAIAALEKNAEETGDSPLMVSIDPYTRLLGAEIKPQRVRFEAIEKPIQHVPVSDLLRHCEEGALLFVDSSHVYKHGSDVWHLTHQVYPALPSGTLVHIHDIVLPHPWPKDFLVKNKWFWNEQDMLEQFLAFNQSFRIVLPVHWLHRHSDRVKRAVSDVAGDLPQRDSGFSFYIERIA